VPKVFVLLGRPGSGKTTVSDYYSKITNFPVVHVGQEIRKLASQGHMLAKDVAEDMQNARDYDPQKVTTILSEIISNNPKFTNGLILDGFPRFKNALPAFEEFLKKNNLKMGKVILFKVPKSQSIQRQLSRKRDSKEVIKLREENFSSVESELIEHYKKQGLLKTLRAMNFKRRKKKVPEYFLKIQAKNLGKIIRSAKRKS